MHDKLANSHDQLFVFEQEETYAMHKNGYIIPVQLVIALYPQTDKGLCFWILIRPLSKKGEFMVVSDRGIIDGCSEKIGEELMIGNNKDIKIK